MCRFPLFGRFSGRLVALLGHARRLSILLCFLACGPWLLAEEGSLELAWNPNGDGVTTGYKVHYGTTSGDYDRSLDVGSACEAWVPDLEVGRRYYFAVTAYGEDGLESPHSAELSATPRTKPLPVGARPARLARFSRLPSGLLDFKVERGALVGEVLVYGSDDLKHWKLVCSLPSLSTGFQLDDPDAAGEPRRFYRAVTRFLADR